MRAMHFQQIPGFYSKLPRNLCLELRRVADAASDKEAFGCCCTLLEALTLHLDNLCNSV